jgi:hypothetical protein
VTAALDSVLPPIRVWSLFAILWFIAHGALRSWSGVILPLQPRLIASVGIAVLGFLLGAAWLGPMAVLPLAFPPAYAVLRALIPRVQMPDSVRKRLRIAGAVALSAVAILGAWSVHEVRTRTEAQFIADWSATAIGRAHFKALQAKEPSSLAAYRELLMIGDGTVAAQSAERIARIGDPAVDVPLLERALIRFGSDDGTAEAIAQAIHQLRAKRNAVYLRFPMRSIDLSIGLSTFV